MTALNIIEIVRLTHPMASMGEIYMYINLAIDDLLRYSKYTKTKLEDFETTEDTISYDEGYPVIDILSVKVEDKHISRIAYEATIGQNDGLVDGEYYYWIFDDSLHLVKGGKETGYLPAGLDVSVTAIKGLMDISPINDIPQTFPAVFYEAIITKASMMLFSRGELNPNAIMFLEKSYNILKRRLRNEANTRKNPYGRRVLPVDY